ncbi:MAG: hypothetical protein GEU74_13445 [Nitriliruptorales bacterium]|nr:hypothetical protein [Nitriliruptorales bacterium]
MSQLRGSFRLARVILVAGAMSTALGAGIYALSLPGDDADAPEDTGETVMRFVPGVETDDGDQIQLRLEGLVGDLAACNDVVLPGRLQGDIGLVTTVVVSEPEGCAGRWQLPVGNWTLVAGVPTPPADQGDGEGTGNDDEATTTTSTTG